MKKQIVREFITVKKVRYLPQPPPPPPPIPPRHVLVVGRCMLDLTSICEEHPTPGTITHTDRGSCRPGGHATNVCFVLRRLGKDCEFLGQLSSDPTFDSLSSSLQAMGIRVSNCPRTKEQPPHRIIVSVHDSHTTVEYSKRRHLLTYQQFVGAVDYRQCSWIHFEASNSTDTLRMIRAVRDYNERTPDTKIVLSLDLIDLKPISCLMADIVDYVFIRKIVLVEHGFMNGREVVWAVRDRMHVARKRWQAMQPKKSPYISEEEPLPDPNTCKAQAGHEPIVIYDDYAEGPSCLLADNTFFKVGGHKPQQVLDAIGEHAAFIGAFITMIEANKLSLRDAIEYGARASCLKASNYGFDCLRCMPKDLISCYYT